MDTLLTVLVSNCTETIKTGSLIAFGKVTTPIWVTNQVGHIERLIQLIDTTHTAGPALSQAVIHSLFTMSHVTVVD